MFYSHTFLARKGPLGTVWFAAHLQNRLKKSHYTSTDISSTVGLFLSLSLSLSLIDLFFYIECYIYVCMYLCKDDNFFFFTE